MKLNATVTGSDGLYKVVDVMVGAKQAARIKASNQKAADEFMSLVRFGVPQDPNAKHGHLIDTLKKEDVGETGVQVSIGGGAESYPAHLEFGHRARDGTHVAARPFWFPSKRIIWKRAHARMLSAQRAAIKAAAASVTNG